MINVWKTNLEEEIKHLITELPNFNCVAMVLCLGLDFINPFLFLVHIVSRFADKACRSLRPNVLRHHEDECRQSEADSDFLDVLQRQICFRTNKVSIRP